jgi:hypothetical protein
MALAQAELQAGDRVAAENYYQHAETLFQIDLLGWRCEIEGVAYNHG